LKNIAEPIHVYSLEVGQQAPARPAPSAAQAPAKPVPSAAPDDHRAAIKHIRAKRAFGLHATVYVTVNLLLIAVWALTGRGYFWPIWPVLGWGVGLGVHYWTVFFRRPISADEIRRELQKRP
jgi:2TM domain